MVLKLLKGKKIFVVVLGILLLVLLHVFNRKIEGFTGDDVKKLNAAFASIIECKKKTCDQNVIKNFGDFKKQFPNFNILFFHDLMKKREEKGSDLTESEINDIATKGKYSTTLEVANITPASPPTTSPPTTVPSTVPPTTNPSSSSMQIPPQVAAVVQLPVNQTPATPALANPAPVNPTTMKEKFSSFFLETFDTNTTPPTNNTTTTNTPVVGKLDPNSKAGQCQQSIDDLNALITATKERNEKKYNDDIAAWTQKRNNIQNQFARDPQQWADYCGSDPSRCTGENFFTEYANTWWDGNDIPGGEFDGSQEECRRRCIARTDCYKYNWRPSRCWLGGKKEDHGAFDAAGFKSQSGFRAIPNINIDGRNTIWEGGSASIEDCQSKCQNDSRCFGYLHAKDNRCWLKGAVGNGPGAVVGVKELVTRQQLPDTDRRIVDGAGAKPSKNDLQYNDSITISNIVCQDCRSQMGDIKTEQSKDVALSQLNNCVANLAQSESQAKEQAKTAQGGTSTGTTGGTSNAITGGTNSSPLGAAPVAPGNEPRQNANASETSPSNRNLYIGLGVGFAFLILIAIMFGFLMLMRNQ